MDHWQNLIGVKLNPEKTTTKKLNPEHFLQFRAAQVGGYISGVWYLVQNQGIFSYDPISPNELMFRITSGVRN